MHTVLHGKKHGSTALNPPLGKAKTTLKGIKGTVITSAPKDSHSGL